MHSDRSAWINVVGVVALSGVLAACDSLSDVDEQENLSPTAVAHVIGYDGPDANGNVAIDVRAGSELALTGKESAELDKPIVTFLWEPSNEAANSALLTVRNSSTVSVSVPQVSVATPMEFTLTVSDSDGDTDTATVTLNVQPILDSDRFLQYVRNVAKFRVVAATDQPRNSTGSFQIQLSAHVEYKSRSGDTRTVDYSVGEPIEGNWLPSSNAGNDCENDPSACVSDSRNPMFEFGIPAVDLDAITRRLQEDLVDLTEFPELANMVADPALVDDAKLDLSIILTPLTAVANATLYVVVTDDGGNDVVFGEPVSNAGSGAAVELRLDDAQVNELRIAGGGLENVETAKSYYDAIDPDPNPDTKKDTLEKWLTANCFVPSAADYDADTHAVYVNNFDLGFGRDMYFRTRPCNNSNAGTVASVVINYLTLEGAVKKIDPIIAVAMENVDTDPDDDIPGVVTFYAFAPEQGGTTGDFRRVRTVNFDGRGEKFLPGACTMCHGGRPQEPEGLATYSEGDKDVGATFMPWDLESFLYSDDPDISNVDASFPTDASNASFRVQYTREAQESQFKALNLAAYHTYGHGSGADFECYAGFEGPCELVQLWYGADLSELRFLNDQTALGWIDEEELYQDVFARHCRACHVQRVAEPDTQVDTQLQFRTDDDFFGRSLAIENQVFDIGGMPAARLTMDRLWEPDEDLGKSAGEVLEEHLGLLPGSRPGPCFENDAGIESYGSPESRQEVERGVLIGFTSGCSGFRGNLTWSLTKVPTNSAAAMAAIDGIRTALTSEDPDDQYDVTLKATLPNGDELSRTMYLRVQDLIPNAPDFPNIMVGLNDPFEISVLGEPGDEPENGHSTVQIGSISDPGLVATLDQDQRIVVTASTVAGGTVAYSITDLDGDIDSGLITVSVTASVAANDLSSASVIANSANNEINLTGSIVAHGQPVQVTIVSSPATSLVGKRGTRGSVSIVSCTNDPQRDCAAYRPPEATISRFGSTAIGNPDSFDYQACFEAQPATCDTGTVTVQIEGQFEFAPVASLLQTKCVACHQAAQSGSTWSLAAGATEKAAWCAVALPDQAGSEEADPGDPDSPLYPGDSGRTMIDLQFPAESLLDVKPSRTVLHGPLLSSLVTADELSAIRNWIGEGGAFTGDSDQTCTP